MHFHDQCKMALTRNYYYFDCIIFMHLVETEFCDVYIYPRTAPVYLLLRMTPPGNQEVYDWFFMNDVTSCHNLSLLFIKGEEQLRLLDEKHWLHAMYSCENKKGLEGSRRLLNICLISLMT